MALNCKRAGQISLLPYLLTGLLLGLLAACQTVVELDLPEEPPVLVVNAVLNPDSALRVRLTSSQSAFTSGPYPPVTDATVQLYRDGQLMGELSHLADGLYEVPGRAVAGSAYELRASAPGLPPVRSTTQVLPVPAVSGVRGRRAAPSSSGSPTFDVSLVLTDPPGQANYYYLRAYSFDQTFGDNPIVFRRSLQLQLLAPLEAEFSTGIGYFISDKLFDGQALRLLLNIESLPGRRIYLRVAQVPRAYYDYVRLLDKQFVSDNVFALPVVVSNNIEGGLGLFTSVNDTLL